MSIMKKKCENFVPTIGCFKDICSCNNNPKKPPFKHESRILSKEEVLANRSNAYEFIDFDKQETLKQAAKECLINNGLPIEGDFGEGYITGAMFGAKWQQEQDKNKYSEEEVRNIIEQTIDKFYKHIYSDKTKAEMKEIWFEQFKNK